jgi:hypothetical protein
MVLFSILEETRIETNYVGVEGVDVSNGDSRDTQVYF